MTDDIVARLRLRTDPSQMLMCYPPRPAPDMLCCEAAAKIERLRERRDDWRAAMTENHDLWNENEQLLKEIQQLKHDSTIFINDLSDAICENFDFREENAELRDEIERLRAALLKISELEPEGPLGNDCMAVSYASETARAALEGEASDDAAT